MDINSILSHFGDTEISKISSQTGIDNNHVTAALQGALPALITALNGNAQSKAGQKSLATALEKDHDGSLLDNLSSFLDAPSQGNGKGILNHTFASRRTEVENTLGAKAGVNSQSMGKILEIAAPVVMAYLGKKKKEDNLDGGGISSALSELFRSNLNSSNDPSDNGLDVGDIATMFLGNKEGHKTGIAGIMDAFFGR